MATVNINNKLSEVLKIFLSPNFNTSTTYFDLLLTHISKITDSCKKKYNTY